MTSTDWKQQAACRTQDPTIMVGADFSGPTGTDLIEAVLTCAGCPVFTECNRYATRNPETIAGVYAGKVRIPPTAPKPRIPTIALADLLPPADRYRTAQTLHRLGWTPHRAPRPRSRAVRIVWVHDADYPEWRRLHPPPRPNVRRSADPASAAV